MTLSTRSPILPSVLVVALNVLAIGMLSAQMAVASPEDPEPSLRPSAPLVEAPRPGTLFGDASVAPSGRALPILAAPIGHREPLLRTSVVAVNGANASTDWFRTDGVSLAPEGRQAPGERPGLTGQYGTNGVILMSIGI